MCTRTHTHTHTHTQTHTHKHRYFTQDLCFDFFRLYGRGCHELLRIRQVFADIYFMRNAVFLLLLVRQNAFDTHTHTHAHTPHAFNAHSKLYYWKPFEGKNLPERFFSRTSVFSFFNCFPSKPSKNMSTPNTRR